MVCAGKGEKTKAPTPAPLQCSETNIPIPLKNPQNVIILLPGNCRVRKWFPAEEAGWLLATTTKTPAAAQVCLIVHKGTLGRRAAAEDDDDTLINVRVAAPRPPPAPQDPIYITGDRAEPFE